MHFFCSTGKTSHRLRSVLHWFVNSHEVLMRLWRFSFFLFSFMHSTSLRWRMSCRIGLVYWRCLLEIELQHLSKELPSFKGLGYIQFSRFSSQKTATLKKLTATIYSDRISRSLCWSQNQICYCLCTYGPPILTHNVRFSSFFIFIASDFGWRKSPHKIIGSPL